MTASAQSETQKLHLPPCGLTVIVPVYRNADTLTELVQRLHDALDLKIPDHIILMVDDNSPDDSWQLLNELCRNDYRLAAVKLSANYGQQQALLTGVRLAAASQKIAILDADLQDPPEVLAAMYEKALTTDGAVFAERFGQYESWDRMLMSIAFKSLVGLISGLPRRCGTFFIAPQHVIARVLDFPVSTPQLPIMTRIASRQFTTVRFVRPRRASGESAYNFQRRLKAAYHSLCCAIHFKYASKTRAASKHCPTFQFKAILGKSWVE